MLTFFAFNGFSQEKDTVIAKPIMEKEHSPKKATILSAVLPGAGQVYNKKWWKVPIVYGAIGTLAYMGAQNNTAYVARFSELIYRTNHNGTPGNSEFAEYTDAQLNEEINYHRKWRDNFFVFTGLAYVLNIVDANVDAHFYNFDVSDDLSMSVEPYNTWTPNNSFANGVTLRLKIK